MNYVKIAKQLSKEGYSVIPVNEAKNPAIGHWRTFQMRPMTDLECERNFTDVWGIALLTGGKSKITACDFDLKYSLEDDFYEKIKKSLPVKLLRKMRVQSTKNKGFHWLFKCDKIEPNQKLANRASTEREVMLTFSQEMEKGSDIQQSMRVASNDKVKCLVETRGGTETNCGGYVLIPPTPNYEHVYGHIQEISIDEYDLLMDTLRSFNTYIPPKKEISLATVDSTDEENPFNDFNKRGDGVALLESHGWTILGRTNRNVKLLRPGRVSSASSGLYDVDRNIFVCFSTSSQFDPQVGYNNSSLLMELEGFDPKQAYKHLTELGYGKRK